MAKASIKPKNKPIASVSRSAVRTGSGSAKRATQASFLSSKWAIVAAVVLVGALGSYFLYASHADSFASLYRLQRSGHHFYTTSPTELTATLKAGWKLESTSQYVNEAGSQPVPVYRLRHAGDHYYTVSIAQRTSAVKAGWVYEGIAFKSASSPFVPVGYCRQAWIQLAAPGKHFYTPSAAEANQAQKTGYVIQSYNAFALDTPCPAVSQPVSSPVSGPVSGPLSGPMPAI